MYIYKKEMGKNNCIECKCKLNTDENENIYKSVREDGYDGMCVHCFIEKHQNLNMTIGRFCNECGDELRMYKWVAVYGIKHKEYCLDCCDDGSIETDDIDDEPDFKLPYLLKK